MLHAGTHTDCTMEYRRYMARARKWARYALQNKSEGLPWIECAKIARENFNWARKLTG